MKVCTECRASKPLTEYNTNRSQSDGLQSRCRPCDNRRNREYYRQNRDVQAKLIRRRTQERIQIAQAYVLEFKLANPCMDCGETDPVVLDFDHLRDKHRGVSDMASHGTSLRRVRDEIAKCEVVCANCHRRRTAHRRSLLKVPIV